MTKTETLHHYDIHTCFHLVFGDQTWGPYYTKTQALEAMELAKFWIENDIYPEANKMYVNEYLIREYGLDFIREAAVLNLR